MPRPLSHGLCNASVGARSHRYRNPPEVLVDGIVNSLERVRGVGRMMVAKLWWLVPLLTRVSLGTLFVGTGWGKLHSLDTVTEYFTSLGIPMPPLNALMAAATEFGCGLLLIAGLATRLAAVPLTV